MLYHFKMSKTNITNLNKVSLLAYLINLGISVPHYCYHNNLSIAGNCRICIVEMGNLNKPVVSCAVSAEITGIEELGVFGRGNQSEIGTYVNKVLLSELSGNVIDLCPVGVITKKSYFSIKLYKNKNIRDEL